MDTADVCRLVHRAVLQTVSSALHQSEIFDFVLRYYLGDSIGNGQLPERHFVESTRALFSDLASALLADDDISTVAAAFNIGYDTSDAVAFAAAVSFAEVDLRRSVLSLRQLVSTATSRNGRFATNYLQQLHALAAKALRQAGDSAPKSTSVSVSLLLAIDIKNVLMDLNLPTTASQAAPEGALAGCFVDPSVVQRYLRSVAINKYSITTYDLAKFMHDVTHDIFEALAPEAVAAAGPLPQPQQLAREGSIDGSGRPSIASIQPAALAASPRYQQQHPTNALAVLDGNIKPASSADAAAKGPSGVGAGGFSSASSVAAVTPSQNQDSKQLRARGSSFDIVKEAASDMMSDLRSRFLSKDRGQSPRLNQQSENSGSAGKPPRPPGASSSASFASGGGDAAHNPASPSSGSVGIGFLRSPTSNAHSLMSPQQQQPGAHDNAEHNASDTPRSTGSQQNSASRRSRPRSRHLSSAENDPDGGQAHASPTPGRAPQLQSPKQSSSVAQQLNLGSPGAAAPATPQQGADAHGISAAVAGAAVPPTPMMSPGSMAARRSSLFRQPALLDYASNTSSAPQPSGTSAAAAATSITSISISRRAGQEASLRDDGYECLAADLSAGAAAYPVRAWAQRLSPSTAQAHQQQKPCAGNSQFPFESLVVLPSQSDLKDRDAYAEDGYIEVEPLASGSVLFGRRTTSVGITGAIEAADTMPVVTSIGLSYHTLTGDSASASDTPAQSLRPVKKTGVLAPAPLLDCFPSQRSLISAHSPPPPPASQGCASDGGRWIAAGTWTMKLPAVGTTDAAIVDSDDSDGEGAAARQARAPTMPMLSVSVCLWYREVEVDPENLQSMVSAGSSASSGIRADGAKASRSDAGTSMTPAVQRGASQVDRDDDERSDHRQRGRRGEHRGRGRRARRNSSESSSRSRIDSGDSYSSYSDGSSSDSSDRSRRRSHRRSRSSHGGRHRNNSRRRYNSSQRDHHGESRSGRQGNRSRSRSERRPHSNSDHDYGTDRSRSHSPDWKSKEVGKPSDQRPQQQEAGDHKSTAVVLAAAPAPTSASAPTEPAATTVADVAGSATASNAAAAGAEPSEPQDDASTVIRGVVVLDVLKLQDVHLRSGAGRPRIKAWIECSGTTANDETAAAGSDGRGRRAAYVVPSLSTGGAAVLSVAPGADAGDRDDEFLFPKSLPSETAAAASVAASTSASAAAVGTNSEAASEPDLLLSLPPFDAAPSLADDGSFRNTRVRVKGSVVCVNVRLQSVDPSNGGTQQSEGSKKRRPSWPKSVPVHFRESAASASLVIAVVYDNPRGGGSSSSIGGSRGGSSTGSSSGALSEVKEYARTSIRLGDVLDGKHVVHAFHDLRTLASNNGGGKDDATPAKSSKGASASAGHWAGTIRLAAMWSPLTAAEAAAARNREREAVEAWKAALPEPAASNNASLLDVSRGRDNLDESVYVIGRTGSGASTAAANRDVGPDPSQVFYAVTDGQARGIMSDSGSVVKKAGDKPPLLLPPTLTPRQQALFDRLRKEYQGAQSDASSTGDASLMSIMTACSDVDVLCTGLLPARALPRILSRCGVKIDSSSADRLLRFLLELSCAVVLQSQDVSSYQLSSASTPTTLDSARPDKHMSSPTSRFRAAVRSAMASPLRSPSRNKERVGFDLRSPTDGAGAAAGTGAGGLTAGGLPIAKPNVDVQQQTTSEAALQAPKQLLPITMPSIAEHGEALYVDYLLLNDLLSHKTGVSSDTSSKNDTKGASAGTSLPAVFVVETCLRAAIRHRLRLACAGGGVSKPITAVVPSVSVANAATITLRAINDFAVRACATFAQLNGGEPPVSDTANGRHAPQVSPMPLVAIGDALEELGCVVRTKDLAVVAATACAYLPGQDDEAASTGSAVVADGKRMTSVQGLVAAIVGTRLMRSTTAPSSSSAAAGTSTTYILTSSSSSEDDEVPLSQDEQMLRHALRGCSWFLSHLEMEQPFRDAASASSSSSALSGASSTSGKAGADADELIVLPVALLQQVLQERLVISVADYTLTSIQKRCKVVVAVRGGKTNSSSNSEAWMDNQGALVSAKRFLSIYLDLNDPEYASIANRLAGNESIQRAKQNGDVSSYHDRVNTAFSVHAQAAAATASVVGPGVLPSRYFVKACRDAGLPLSPQEELLLARKLAAAPSTTSSSSTTSTSRAANGGWPVRFEPLLRLALPATTAPGAPYNVTTDTSSVHGSSKPSRRMTQPALDPHTVAFLLSIAEPSQRMTITDVVRSSLNAATATPIAMAASASASQPPLPPAYPLATVRRYSGAVPVPGSGAGAGFVTVSGIRSSVNGAAGGGLDASFSSHGGASVRSSVTMMSASGPFRSSNGAQQQSATASSAAAFVPNGAGGLGISMTSAGARQRAGSASSPSRDALAYPFNTALLPGPAVAGQTAYATTLYADAGTSAAASSGRARSQVLANQAAALGLSPDQVQQLQEILDDNINAANTTDSAAAHSSAAAGGKRGDALAALEVPLATPNAGIIAAATSVQSDGVLGQLPSAATSDDQSQRASVYQTTGRWACQVCFYQGNRPYSRFCSMCEGENPFSRTIAPPLAAAATTSAVTVGSSASPARISGAASTSAAAAVVPSVAQQPTPPVSWLCPACAFTCRPGTEECLMCGTHLSPPFTKSDDVITAAMASAASAATAAAASVAGSSVRVPSTPSTQAPSVRVPSTPASSVGQAGPLVAAVSPPAAAASSSRYNGHSSSSVTDGSSVPRTPNAIAGAGNNAAASGIEYQSFDDARLRSPAALSSARGSAAGFGPHNHDQNSTHEQSQVIGSHHGASALAAFTGVDSTGNLHAQYSGAGTASASNPVPAGFAVPVSFISDPWTSRRQRPVAASGLRLSGPLGQANNQSVSQSNTAAAVAALPSATLVPQSSAAPQLQLPPSGRGGQPSAVAAAAGAASAVAPSSPAAGSTAKVLFGDQSTLAAPVTTAPIAAASGPVVSGSSTVAARRGSIGSCATGSSAPSSGRMDLKHLEASPRLAPPASAAAAVANSGTGSGSTAAAGAKTVHTAPVPVSSPGADAISDALRHIDGMSSSYVSAVDYYAQHRAAITDTRASSGTTSTAGRSPARAASGASSSVRAFDLGSDRDDPIAGSRYSSSVTSRSGPGHAHSARTGHGIDTYTSSKLSARERLTMAQADLARARTRL